MKRVVRIRYLIVLAVVAAGVFLVADVLPSNRTTASASAVNNSADTTTPIKHVVVIYDENESFDHYFGTYPYAANTDGTTFTPAVGTPGLPGSSETVNTELAAGLIPNTKLGTAVANPNGGTVVPNPNATGGYAAIARDPNATSNAAAPDPNEYQPQRVPATTAVTCDNNHGYTQEQEAEDDGKMDDFVQYTSAACGNPGATGASAGIAMDYIDGNSVTALWNYAQNYAMSDNSWDATFGPTVIGNMNMFGATTYSTIGRSTYTSNDNPEWDNWDGASAEMGGEDIGDLLNDDGVSWGWFEGGFTEPEGTSADNVDGDAAAEFSSIYDSPDNWKDTSNAAHTPPASGSEIGFAGPANHQYDLSDFTEALDDEYGASLPAVSFLRADQLQNGHPSVSDPVDEQEFLTKEINDIEQSSYWPSTAIIVEYDDSDGWYDHQVPTITNSSDSGGDAGVCTSASGAGVPELGGEPGRCGPSQRLPYLVISPYAKKNYVDHTVTTQDSTLKFIEQNWDLGVMGSYTFDNTPDSEVGTIDGFFDWQAPQQNEVLLDGTCNVSSLSTALDKCNNTTAHATSDGVGDAGFGAVSSTPMLSTAVQAAPLETVAHDTISVPASANGTLSPNTVLSLSGASIDDGGTLTADVSNVDLAQPGTYMATVSGKYDAGSGDDIPSMDSVTVDVDVTPTISVPNTTLTYEASNPPSAAQILRDAGASINGGALDSPDLSGLMLSAPGAYTVDITGSEDGEEATPVPVTIDVIPTPTITVGNSTVDYQVGQSPTPAEVLTDADATINTGTLAQPDISGVDFATPGRYQVTIDGASAGFDASPVTITITVDTAAVPAITVPEAAVAYLVGADPSPAQVLKDSGAKISAGTLTTDLSQVDFGAAGTYAATVTGSDDGTNATSVPLTVNVVNQPVVTLGSAVVDTIVGQALTSEEILTGAGAVVSGGGDLKPVDLSAVDFGEAGDYTVSVAGDFDGLTASPATLTIDVLTAPKVKVADSRLSYPVGAKVDAADVLSQSGASIAGGGDVNVDLAGVDLDKPGNYSVKVTGEVDGVAATSAAVTVTVRPVIKLKHATIKYTAGVKQKAASILKAAGATISSGKLSSPSLTKVIFTEAGLYQVSINGSANRVNASAVTLTIEIEPKLTVAHKSVKIARGTRLTKSFVLAATGAKARGYGKEILTASITGVNTKTPGEYAARILVAGKDNKPVTASVGVRVTVIR